MYKYTSPTGEEFDITGPHPNMIDLGTFLKDVPPGNWVAASNNGDHVVAYAVELADALRLAKERGEPTPIILKKREYPVQMIL